MIEQHIFELLLKKNDKYRFKLIFNCLIVSLILFQIIYLNASPAAVYKTLTDGSEWSLLNFRDASGGPPLFDISLLDVLHGIKVAHDARFFDFEHFDADQYLFYEVSNTTDIYKLTLTIDPLTSSVLNCKKIKPVPIPLVSVVYFSVVYNICCYVHQLKL